MVDVDDIVSELAPKDKTFPADDWKTALDTVALELPSLQYLHSHRDWSVTFRLMLDDDRVVAVRLIRLRKAFTPATQRDLTRLNNVQNVVPYSRASRFEAGDSYFLMTVRPFVKTVLADSRMFDAPRKARPLSDGQKLRRAHVVKSVMKGVLDLHSQELPHGDIRPANVEYDARQTRLLDPFTFTPIEAVSKEQRSYISPEAHSRLDRTPPDDIYSIGRLLVELLLDSLPGDSMVPLTGMTARQLRVVVDAMMLAPMDERASAAEVWGLIFEKNHRYAQRTREYLDLGAAQLIRRLTDSNTDGLGLLIAQDVVSAARTSIEERLNLYPHTQLEIFDAAAGAALLALTPFADIDKYSTLAHSHTHTPMSVEVTSLFESKHPAGIDEEWMRGILSGYLDIDTVSSVEEAVAMLSDDDRQLFDLELRTADANRKFLLDNANYLNAASLAHLMSRPGLLVSAENLALQREWGDLLGVEDHGTWLHPHFQFDPRTGLPYQAIRDSLRALPKGESTWALLSWWLARNPELGDVAPRDFLGTESDDLVLSALRRELGVEL